MKCLDGSVLGETARLDLQHHVCLPGCDSCCPAAMRRRPIAPRNVRFRPPAPSEKCTGDRAALVLEQGLPGQGLHPGTPERPSAAGSSCEIHEARAVHGRPWALRRSTPCRPAAGKPQKVRTMHRDTRCCGPLTNATCAPEALRHLTQQRLEIGAPHGFRRGVSVNSIKVPSTSKNKHHSSDGGGKRFYHDAKLTGWPSQ